MFGRQRARVAAISRKLHSIPAIMRERNFEGSFSVAGRSYSFSFEPVRAEIVSGGSSALAPRASAGNQSKRAGDERLRLSGSVTVIDARPNARGSPRNIPNVQAELLATQGGIGAAPPRKKLPPDITPPGDLPIVESTGSLSFCGVLYFKLAPLDGRAVGVAAELTGVQLNARLAPRNDRERELQAAYSSITDALYGKETDASAAKAALDELNTLLAR